MRNIPAEGQPVIVHGDFGFRIPFGASSAANWIGMYASGSGDGAYLTWKYASSCTQSAGASGFSNGAAGSGSDCCD